MNVIFIRGVPGVGKTIVANRLKEELSNAEVICVDSFKLEAMKKGNSFEDSQEIAYNQALKELYNLYTKNKSYVIIDEIICEKDFLNRLYKFLDKTKSNAYWFRLMRKIRELLDVESNRKRKIKNNLEDFSKLKRDIESLKIKDEHCIKNDDFALTVRKILTVIKH